jgi:hypothetical protein
VKILGMTVGVFIAVFVVVAGLAFGGVYWAAFYSSTTADTRGTTEQREQNAASGAFRQATYEEFFNLCAAVQADEAKVENLKAEQLGTDDPSRAQRIGTSITAVMNARAESIAEYNSKAAQKHREQFQDSDLPYRLDLNNMETECAA